VFRLEAVGGLAVGRRLHVSGEDGAVDLVLPRHLRERVGHKIRYIALTLINSVWT